MATTKKTTKKTAKKAAEKPEAAEAPEAEAIKTEGEISTVLELVETLSVDELFTPGKDKEVIKRIEEEVAARVFDVSTPQGRADCKAFAHAISKSKSLMDGGGKKLVKGWKDKAAVIDGQRKYIRDECDRLRIEARKPLTEWEEKEEKRKAAIQDKINYIKQLSIVNSGAGIKTVDELDEQIVKASAIDLDSFEEFKPRVEELYDATMARLKEARKTRMEQDAKDKELAELRKQAEEREAKEKEEARKRELAERQAKAEAAQKEREEQIKAEEAAKAEKRLAEEKEARIRAEEREKTAREEAARVERDKAETAKREEEAKQAKREANKRLRKKAIDALVEDIQLVSSANAEIALEIAKAISEDRVRSVTFNV